MQQLVAGNKSFQLIFEKLKFYWNSGTRSGINEELALARVWLKIGNPEPLLSSGEDEPPVKPLVRMIRWRRILVAATLIPLIALGMWWFGIQTRKVDLVEKYNQKGIRSTITLPDGSRVWLNSDSRLKYPAFFGTSLREVYLEGEAFFEIARNPSRPFVVRLPKGTVNVLGTSFNIRAYGNEDLLTTSVATGKVAFVPGQAKDDSFYLSSGLKAVYHLRYSGVTVEPTDPDADKGWINGVLVFNNETLGQIAVELERYFGKPVNFGNASVAQYRYSATFKNNSAEEILELLKRVKTFHYTVTDKYIGIDK
ncbi:FecR family protein [Flavitalea flava]